MLFANIFAALGMGFLKLLQRLRKTKHADRTAAEKTDDSGEYSAHEVKLIVEYFSAARSDGYRCCLSTIFDVVCLMFYISKNTLLFCQYRKN